MSPRRPVPRRALRPLAALLTLGLPLGLAAPASADKISASQPLALDGVSQVIGVNNSGQAVGSGPQPGGGYGPVVVGIAGSGSSGGLFNSGVAAPLGTLNGGSATPMAINDNGQVAGTAGVGNTATNHAFVADGKGNVQDLGTLPGGTYSSANALNNAGQVVGSSQTGSGDTHAFIASGGVLTDLGTLGGAYSAANGINAFGQVVGMALTSNNASHAFLYSNGTMTDLGTLPGGGSSTATAINGAGQVIGQSSVPGSPGHAFIYSNGSMTDMGVASGFYKSSAESINASGQVVGEMFSLQNLMNQPSTHAFLYDHGVLTDLNSLLPANSGWVLTNARSINDNGLVVGVGTFNGQTQSFAFQVEAVPEPTTLAFAGLIALAAAGRAVYRHKSKARRTA